MLNKDEIVQHFDNALSFGQKYEQPYLLYSFTAFPQHVYKAMVQNLPDDSLYFEMKHPEAIRPDGTSSRLELQLTQGKLKRLPPDQREFWGELNAILRSDELRDVFKKWLEPELTKRFNCPLSEVPAYPAPLLLRDSYGYKISVHHDTDTKVITTQYYLPTDESQRHLGTNINERRPNGGAFDLVRRLEFVPNRGYCFSVSKYSWHSVNPMTPADGKRNSLMLVYMRESGMSY
jgi:hypothetical protein